MTQTYDKAFDIILSAAKPATGLTRSDIEQKIAGVTETLRGPCGNVERIMLCADRKSLQLALAELEGK